MTRAHSRRPIQLTRRGERVVGCLYTVVIMAAGTLTLLALLGLAGWIETAP